MKRPIEPGLLTLFRYSAVIGVLYFFARWIYELSLQDNQEVVFQVSFFMIVHALLLVYLLVPWLEKQLKEYYLPLILVLYTAAMVFGSLLYLYTPNRNINVFISNSISLVPVLIVPLVFIAWQYDFKHVLFYTLFTNIADLLIALMIVRKVSLDQMPMLSMPIIRAFAFLMVGFVVSQLTEAQRRQKHRLLLANVQLSQYTNTLEHLAVSRERNRLARELHDTIAHTLSGISVNLEALKTIEPGDNPEMTEMIDSSLKAARNGLSDTRRALRDLRAQPLEDLGLELSLRQLVDSIADRSGVAVHLDIDNDLPYLAPNVEQVFFRIAQEALENAARHANAKQIRLDLHQEGEVLWLTIKDDGLGFNEKDIQFDNHFGVKGMYERSLTIGAELSIQSKPGEGTTVTLRWERLS